MEDLYREIIIDHYKNPQYRGHLDPNNIQFEDDNPLCGDHIEITLKGGSGKQSDRRQVRRQGMRHLASFGRPADRVSDREIVGGC